MTYLKKILSVVSMLPLMTTGHALQVDLQGENSSRLCEQMSLETVASPEARGRDYGITFWQDGIRGRDAKGRRVLCIQTGYYALSFDVEQASLLKMGSLKEAKAYQVAVREHNRKVDALPAAFSELQITVDGELFTCVRGAEPLVLRTVPELPENYWVIAREKGRKILDGLKGNKQTNLRLRDYGRYRQDFEIDRLVFVNAKGKELDVRARMLVESWPDTLSWTLEIVPEVDLSSASASIIVSADELKTSVSSPVSHIWPAGERQRVVLPMSFSDTARNGSENSTLEVTDLQTGKQVEVIYNSALDAYKVMLNNYTYPSQVINRLDRYQVRMVNESAVSRTFRMIFANEMGYHELKLSEENRGEGAVSGTMGALAILGDKDGKPIGLPVQNSHNWPPLNNSLKATPELMPWLVMDPWDYASWLRYSVVGSIPGQSKWIGRVDLSHALYGGIPQASYYFLTLIGWGYYTHWDVAIQGDFGESLCYALGGYADADITDVRPLYVRSYDSKRKVPFQWTPNQGGGNFLHYINESAEKIYLVPRRSTPVPGPALTKTVFSGFTEDGKIRFNIMAEHPRTDDVNRVYYRIEYEVIEDTEFEHMAFFQYGSTSYNFFNPAKVAWGDRVGLNAEIETEFSNTISYFRRGLAFENEAPWWLSMHESTLAEGRGDQADLGLSSRGLIIRSWEAVLGGEPVHKPHLSLMTTNHRYPGMLAEISPPPELKYLKKGDHVSMQLEMFLLPKYAESYLGTNYELRQSLLEHADSWEGVYRMADRGDLKIAMKRGSLNRELPVEIVTDDQGVAEFEVTGGVAYVPFTFTGVADFSNPRLEKYVTGNWVAIDQSDHGNDFWQTVRDPESDTYSFTFNVHLDSPKDKAATRLFRFSSAKVLEAKR